MKNTMGIWITSDEHYGHEKIIKLCGRPFKSVKHMDEALIKNHNKVVQPGDDVYHLGDFAWKDRNFYLQQLNGHHYLIQGNHDHFVLNTDYTNTLFRWVLLGYLLQVEQNSIWLSHYPHLMWPQVYNHGSGGKLTWHAFGHIHNNELYNQPNYSINVCVELWKYKPVSWDQVIKYFKGR